MALLADSHTSLEQSRTSQTCCNLLRKLYIRHHLIPALAGRIGITDMERDLLALPTWLGGIGIPDPSKTCNDHFRCSQRIYAPLTTLILQQQVVCPPSVPNEQTSIKNKIKAQQRQEQTNAAAKLHDKRPSNLQQAMDFGREKGASHWLVVLPQSKHGFTLHKGAFSDAIKLRYGWKLPHLPSHACDPLKHDTDDLISEKFSLYRIHFIQSFVSLFCFVLFCFISFRFPFRLSGFTTCPIEEAVTKSTSRPSLL